MLGSNLQDVNQFRYVRIAAPPTGTDIKYYDLGIFYLATDGGSTSGRIGELHVFYEIELKTPQIINSLISNLGSLITANGLQQTNILMGITPQVSALYPVITEVSDTGPQTVTLASLGSYIADQVVTGTGLGAWVSPLLAGGVILSQFALTNAAQTIATYFLNFRVDQLPAILTLPALTAATTLTAGAMRFAPYAYARLGD